MDILWVISKVWTSIPLAMELNHIRGHQDDRIPDQLLDCPSQINIKCNVLETMLVREEWKHNGSTREALPHEGIICKVAGSKATGDTGKEYLEKRSKRKMNEFLAHNYRVKITNFDLVDWEAVDKMMNNSSHQFFTWVTKHVSKFCVTKKMLHRWGELTYLLCPCYMPTGFQEDKRHHLHLLDKEREELFDEDIHQFAKKLAYMETHPNLRQSLLKFVIGKRQV